MDQQLLETLRVIALPTKTKFRGITVREVALFKGEFGWAEFSPFLEYDDVEASHWLASAIEAATTPRPQLFRTSVAVNGTIPSLNDPAQLKMIIDSFPGVKTFKVKVGNNLEEDLARVDTIRQFQPQAKIRIDVNGLWSVRQAEEFLSSVGEIEYVEQPCATIEELRELLPEPRKFLSIHERGKIHLVPIEQVLFFRAELKYITVRTATRSYILDGALNDLEEKYGNQFIRIHRNALVTRRLVRALEPTGLECLTLYAFSSENWKRPDEEVDDLMNLMRRFIKSDLPEFIANNVKLKIIGDWQSLAPDIVAMLEDALAQTAKGRQTLAVALNYGGQHEIARAAAKAAADAASLAAQEASDAATAAHTAKAQLASEIGRAHV